jgi:uncharacterized lipoprotein
MSPAHYRLPIVVAASLSLTLAGCGSSPKTAPPGKAAANQEQDTDVDTTGSIFTVLGLAKKESERQPGPLTGPTVSPILWQAAKDTLDFVPLTREDPQAGTMTTDWYSPPDKPDERFKIDVFVVSRALHSDSVAVTVERQMHHPDGAWADAPVERKLAEELETTMLHRARQLREKWTAQKS